MKFSALIPVIFSAAIYMAPMTYAQSIEVMELSTAEAFDVGILDGSKHGLDQNLWQGTRAERAVYLLNTVDVLQLEPAVADMLRIVVLTGGVPPEAESEQEEADYAKARLKAILDLGEMGAAQSIIGRTLSLSNDTTLKADMALMAGDNIAACEVADRIIEGRGEPEWARLRAFCHVIRDEIPAAEVTIDILRSTDYADPSYFTLMSVISGAKIKPNLKLLRPDDALHVALMAKAGLEWPLATQSKILAARRALNSFVAPADRLNAFFAAGPALSDQQMGRVLEELGKEDETFVLGGFTRLGEALNAPFPVGTAKLWNIAQFGPMHDRPQAIAELLRRADSSGSFERMAAFLSPSIMTVPAAKQAEINLSLFVRAAVQRRDIATLKNIHDELNSKPELQSRIALVSDALGAGFKGGSLGFDIETRLGARGKIKAQAERDAFIALALGATLSEKSEDQIVVLGPGTGKTIPLWKSLALESAVRDGAKAETILWSVDIMSDGKIDNAGIYKILSALRSVGLEKVAGQLAAADLLAGF